VLVCLLLARLGVFLLTMMDEHVGATTVFVSDYVAGCDGASSKVRRALDIPVDGGPMYAIPPILISTHH